MTNIKQSKDIKGIPSIDRRSFLIGAATLPVTAALQSCADEKNEQSVTMRPKSPGIDYDVIVVGGGFAGVTAARELGVEGHRVLLLEARSRLGGRTFTGSFLDRKVEYGGAAVHWIQPHVFAEMQRYGRGVDEIPLVDLNGSNVMLADGTVVPLVPQKFEEEYGIAMNAFCARAKELFPRPYEPFFVSEVMELENVSAADHIATLGLNDIQKASLNAELTLYAGAPTTEYSYTSFLKLFALAAWDHYTFTDSEKHYKIADGGTLGLCEAILDHSRADVRMGTAVTEITQTTDKVTVVTNDGTKTTARSIIVTVPTKVYEDIKFTPELSDDKTAFIKNAEMCEAAVVFVRFKENLGNTFTFCDDPNPFNAIQTEEFNDDIGTILKLTMGRRSLIDINDIDTVEAELKKIFPEAELLDISAYDWVSDPYSKQGWPSYRVGWFSKYPDMARPEGRFFFAGSATANGWHEYIDGAIESGLRVGREVRELLATSSETVTT